MTTPKPRTMPEEWKCIGCGIKSPNRVRQCECPTAIVIRGKQTDFKINTCKYHPQIPMRENLDGDDLCLECCEKWVHAERERSK